jgi:hypothetical protein
MGVTFLLLPLVQDRLPRVAAGHDVVDCVRKLDSQGACHGANLHNPRNAVNRKQGLTPQIAPSSFFTSRFPTGSYTKVVWYAAAPDRRSLVNWYVAS